MINMEGQLQTADVEIVAPWLKPKTKGRPPWAHSLTRKAIVLSINTNLDNGPLLNTLEVPTDATTTLRTYRNQYFRNDKWKNWRPKDHQRMQERICHMRNLDEPGRGPIELSLAPRFTPQGMAFNKSQTDQAESQVGTDSVDGAKAKLVAFRIRGIRTSNDNEALIEIKFNEHKWKSTIADCGSDIGFCCNLSSSPDNKHEWSSNCSVVFTHVDVERHQLLGDRLLLEALQPRVCQLALNSCNLLHIPLNFNLLTKLKYLNLQRNRLSALEARSLPPNLVTLDVSHNQISEISPQLLKLRSLENLVVAHNAIKILPPWLSNWESLRLLFANGNPLDTKSYYSYWVAFQHCRLGTKYEACPTCISLATHEMKGLLSEQASESILISTEPRICWCNVEFTSASESPDPKCPYGGGYRTLTQEQLDFMKQDTSELISFFNRLSFLSATTRSSISALTLRSSTSRALPDKLPHLDKLVLMSVHCCLRQPDDKRPACMHREIAGWIQSGYTDMPSLETFHTRDLDHNTALHIAARLGATISALQICIERGCDPSLRNREGETFLHLLDGTSRTDVTPLVKEETTKFLTHHKTLLTCTDKRGNTAFHNSRYLQMVFEALPLDKSNPIYRCRFKRNAIGHTLHDYDARLQTPSAPWFECDIHPSKALASTQEVKCFSQPPQIPKAKYPWNKCTRECLLRNLNILHALARLVSLGYVKYYRQSCIDMWSVPELIKHFLETYTCDMGYNDEGLTVTMNFTRAIGKLRPEPGALWVGEVFNILVANDPDITRVDRSGNTALHYAVFYGIPIAVHLIKETKCNVNARNGDGMSVMQLLMETIYREKDDKELYASFQQCLAILADAKAEMHPSLAQELQWDINESEANAEVRRAVMNLACPSRTKA